MADAIKGKGIKETIMAARELAKERLEYEKSKGRLNRAVRVMILGIPNVGKSSFINKLVGKPVAKIGDKPGITRGKQWVRISSEVELLDTPGILWPKFDDINVGLKLAYTGAIKDEIIDIVELAANFLEFAVSTYPEKLKQRYKIDSFGSTLGMDFLKQIGKKRGAIISGGEVDFNRIAQVVLDEFRGAKIGNMSLERPNI
jgi:ribosome biogenesis GTPase A